MKGNFVMSANNHHIHLCFPSSDDKCQFVIPIFVYQQSHVYSHSKNLPSSSTHSNTTVVVDCQLLYVDGETSPSNHHSKHSTGEASAEQVNYVVTKMSQEERVDLRKKL
jgi:hypothetical protein